MVAVRNSTSWRIAAGDQMVVLSGITPVVDSRKWPGVATSSGALADKPYCHTEPAPHSDRQQEQEVHAQALAFRLAREVDSGNRRRAPSRVPN